MSCVFKPILFLDCFTIKKSGVGDILKIAFTFYSLPNLFPVFIESKPIVLTGITAYDISFFCKYGACLFVEAFYYKTDFSVFYTIQIFILLEIGNVFDIKNIIN